jgi:hypothetical protein
MVGDTVKDRLDQCFRQKQGTHHGAEHTPAPCLPAGRLSRGEPYFLVTNKKAPAVFTARALAIIDFGLFLSFYQRKVW